MNVQYQKARHKPRALVCEPGAHNLLLGQPISWSMAAILRDSEVWGGRFGEGIHLSEIQWNPALRLP